MPQSLNVCRFGVDMGLAIPKGGFWSATKTEDEFSVVCEDAFVPTDCQKVEKGWRAFKIEGPLDFSLTGILASLAVPLANATISIFAISTYDTDYVLVKSDSLAKAIEILGEFCVIRN